MGRVVITHSTYIKGLIPWLKLLADKNGVKTITPGVIRQVRGHSKELSLKITAPIRGGFKLVARLASSAQEIFIVTSLSEEELTEKILETDASKKGQSNKKLKSLIRTSINELK